MNDTTSNAFDRSRTADRIRSIVRYQMEHHRVRLLNGLDRVAENLYAMMPSGDYGRGDIRRIIDAEVALIQQEEGK